MHALLRRGLVLFGATWLISPVASARSNPLADMLRASDPALAANERTSFEERLRVRPDDLEVWVAYVESSYRRDQPTETLALLERALRHLPQAAELWRLQAEVFLQDAASGPDWVQRPGMSRGRSPQSTLNEDDFRAQSFAGALAALDRLLAIQPGNREAAERRADALEGLQRWAEADAVLADLLQARPDPLLSAKRARCVLHQGKIPDSLAMVDEALATYPRNASLHYVRSMVLRASGDSAGEADEMARAKFYSRLMPDTALDYTPELASSYARLFGAKPGTGGMFSGDRLNDEIDAEIEVLRQRGDDSARELLAGLAWSHYAHGPQEDRAFATLAEHRDEARLQRIYAQAQSPCTLGGCLRQLVKLRAPGTYEKLCEQLPRDGGMFPIGAVWLLAELNDPRTAQPLITYSRDKEAPMFDEALIALGSFDSPATRKHLDYWMQDKDARPYAATALYQITREEKWLKPVKKFMAKDRLYEISPIANALAEVDTASAREIVAKYKRWRAEDEAKDAAEHAARQAKLKQKT